MKKYILPILVFFFFSCIHKKNSTYNGLSSSCTCKDVSYNLVNCDTTFFLSESKIYWQWNCDSSWLTFETKRGKKQIIQSYLEDKLPLSRSIGPVIIKELNRQLWFRQQKIPGCCYPPSHFILLSKTGERIWEIEENLFVQDYPEKNLIFYFTDTTFSNLVLYDIANNRTTDFTLPKERISKTLKVASVPHVYEIFEKGVIDSNQSEIYYNYYKENSRPQWGKDTIKFKITP